MHFRATGVLEKMYLRVVANQMLKQACVTVQRARSKARCFGIGQETRLASKNTSEQFSRQTLLSIGISRAHLWSGFHGIVALLVVPGVLSSLLAGLLAKGQTELGLALRSSTSSILLYFYLHPLQLFFIFKDIFIQSIPSNPSLHSSGIASSIAIHLVSQSRLPIFLGFSV